jgi:phosphotriesterase-related protein
VTDSRQAATPGVIRTVLGDRPATDFGRCDYHEHLFQSSPLLIGDELDDEDASGAEAAALRRAGIDSMIEATPTGLGRDPAAVARISAATGLSVVHVSGAHREEHYAPSHWIQQLSDEKLRARFEADVNDGLPAADVGPRGRLALTPTGEPVRAGMLKCGIGYWRISRFERQVVGAVASAAAATGVAVMVHLEYGSAAWEVLDALGGGGVPAHRVVLAHADRNLDPGLHAELTLAGAYLGYDGMARHRESPDSAILDCLERTLAHGDPRRILLGGDVARRTRYRSYGGIPGLDYLPTRFLPRLLQRIGADLTNCLLVDNPAQALAIARSAR